MTRTALVTGGGGFLGLYIVEQLLAEGWKVRVLCRGDYPQLRKLGVEIHQADIRNAEQVQAACLDMQAVFHVAAVPGIWGSWEMFHGINTQGTQNVIEACHRQGVRKLIYTSSPSVVFDGHDHINADESLPYPQTYPCHYPHTKALAEQAVLAANGIQGLATCALRPHLIWGPRDNQLIPRLIRRARSGRLVRVGDATNEISMAYVENVASAHLQAASKLEIGTPHAGRAYFINEPTPVSCWGWIDTLLQLAGLKPVRRSISAQTATRIGGVLESIYSALKLQSEPPMTRFLASQLSSSHSYRIDAARRDFGYEPLVTVEEGLRRLEPELRALARR